MIQITVNPHSQSKANVVISSRNNFYNIKDIVKRLPGAYLKDKVWRINAEDVNGLLDKLKNFGQDSTHVDLELFKVVKHVFKRKEQLLSIRNKLEGIDCGIKLVEPYALLPFQHVGVEFINKIGSGIIADKVGLGKTLQGFCAAEKLRRQEKVKKCLIVVNSTMKEKWRRDIKKFLDVDAIILEGSRIKETAPVKVRKEKFHKFIEDNDIFFAIISYDTLARDYEPYIESFKMKDFIVVFDEIQKCKNPETKRSKMCKQLSLKKECKARVGLSATYVETGMDNLFGVMLIIDENVFGHSYMNFANNYIEFDYLGRPTSFKNVDDATDRMQYSAIRRNKEQVKEQLNTLLPKVNENTLWVELENVQKKMYNQVLDRVIDAIQDMERAGKISTANAMSELIYLRQVCLSTELIESSIQSSAKVKLLTDELLPEIIEENKVVIFSFFTTFIDIIERELKKSKIECFAMHGKRSEGAAKNRQLMIDKFSDSKTVQVLVTSDILKEGIDIPAASYVINADILWNPAALIQRNGRIDRLNQQKENIYVINLWSKDTIEEAMYDVVFKREELAKQIIDGGISEQRHRKLSFKDIRSIISRCKEWK